MMEANVRGHALRPGPDAHAWRALFERTDYWRRPGANSADRTDAKEWSYFCVVTDVFELLLIFGVTTETRGGAHCEVPRMVAMLRDATGWSGWIESFDLGACRAYAGELQTRFGPHSLRFDDGSYHIEINGAGPLSARLTLTPESRPSLARSVRLSSAGPMRWLVVPRLSASGTVRAGGTSYPVMAAPAYHDRNWGQFAWGGNFSWEWIVLLPVEAAVDWTIVFMQIADRGRSQLFSRSIMAWHRHAPTRVFHAADITVTRSGVLRPGRIVKIPAVAALAAHGDASDIPARVCIRAARGRDSLMLELRHQDYAQLCLPNDDGCGLTQLTEVRSRASVTGCVDGEPVAYESFAVAEYNHATA
jgi:hypothetical protein